MLGDCRLGRATGHLLPGWSASSAAMWEIHRLTSRTGSDLERATPPTSHFFDCTSVCASRKEGAMETDPLFQMAFVRHPHVSGNDVMN